MIRTRFAPSPTGKLHLGHLLAARVAWEIAKISEKGTFLLRHEDLDRTRVREPYYREIEDDLHWLGIGWPEPPIRQSQRSAAYAEAFEKLHSLGVLYPCFCTRREIQEEQARMANAPHGAEHDLYPDTCRRLSNTERQEKIAAGLPHAWRLDAAKATAITGPLTFHDLRFGKTPVDPRLLGDVVLSRKDIGTAYHLAVVVDDAFQEITHVTRGEDLLDSTHVHRLLQTLLGYPAPVYLHHGLMRDESGKRLAKRNESLSLAALKQRGLTPADVLALTDAQASKALGFWQRPTPLS
ncbi:MAG: tRNA glutamyl-Q(34) synthetase GluQRS [Luteolibacter sp.]